jgi:hypothetical protein
LTGVLLFYFKDYRRPSKDTLENISDIQLPTDFKVIKDEYHDMFQDYCIEYEIQFDKPLTTELIEKIKESKFYNSTLLHDGVWSETDFVTVDSAKAVWSKSTGGYDFNRQDGNIIYSIELDTLTNNLKFNECAD